MSGVGYVMGDVGFGIGDVGCGIGDGRWDVGYEPRCMGVLPLPWVFFVVKRCSAQA